MCSHKVRSGKIHPLKPFRIDTGVESDLKAARVFSKFCALPPLYRRVRASNLAFYKKRDPAAYARMLAHTVEAARQGRAYGEWNDYGRLLE